MRSDMTPMPILRFLGLAAGVAGLLLLLPTEGAAQEDIPTDVLHHSGRPTEGFETPLTMTPEQSQQLHQRALQEGARQRQDSAGEGSGEGAATGDPARVNPYQAILERRAGAAEGADGEAPEGRGFSLEGARFGTPGTTIRTRSDGAIDPVYQGRVPGVNDTPEHVRSELARRGTTRNQLTWIGFQPDGHTGRVFIETAEQPRHEMIRQDGGMQIRIRLRSTDNAIRNHHRAIEARYFNTAVQRVHTTRGPDGSTEVVITLQRHAEPNIRVEDNTLFIEFAGDNAHR